MASSLQLRRNKIYFYSKHLLIPLDIVAIYFSGVPSGEVAIFRFHLALFLQSSVVWVTTWPSS